jgi:hypothetical protein
MSEENLAPTTPVTWLRSVIYDMHKLLTPVMEMHHNEECEQAREDIPADGRGPCTCVVAPAQEAFKLAQAALGDPDLAAALANEMRPPAKPPTGRWRTGTKLHRTLYFENECVGMVDKPNIAVAIVNAMNSHTSRFDWVLQLVQAHASGKLIADEALEKIAEEARELYLQESMDGEMRGASMRKLLALLWRFEEWAKTHPEEVAELAGYAP